MEHLVPIAATATPAGKEATWALSNLVTSSRSVPAASTLVRMGAVSAFIAGIYIEGRDNMVSPCPFMRASCLQADPRP